MKTKIYKSYYDFKNREDKEENGVSEGFASDNPGFEGGNETNEGCWNCSNCNDCLRCRYCKDCDDCIACRHCNSCKSCNHCYYCESCNSLRYRSDLEPK